MSFTDVGDLQEEVSEAAFDATRPRIRCTKSDNCEPGVFYDSVHTFEHGRESLFQGRVAGQVLFGDVKVHRRADEALKQGVMNVARNPSSLPKAFVGEDVRLCQQEFGARVVGEHGEENE